MQPIANNPLAQNVDSILSTFSSHGLHDLKNASLMNRVDSKFLINIEQLPAILAHCRDHYSVLEIEGCKTFRYKSCYFDTDDMQFFNMHHKGKLNRIKIRHRNYIDTGASFLELKFKNNKGRTIKSRVAVCDDPVKALQQAKIFLTEKQVKHPMALNAVQMGEYKRISLANESIGERLTIDRDLSFIDINTQEKSYLNNTVIIELKQSGHNRQSPLYQLMRKMAIRPQSFSKYCMGMTLTSGDTLKTNRFKKNLLKLTKLEKQEYSNEFN